MKVKSVFAAIVWLVAGAASLIAAAYVYAGFWFPDPLRALAPGTWLAGEIMWAGRIVFPPAVLAAAALLVALRLRKVSVQSCVLAFVSAFLSAAVLYFALSFLYYRTMELAARKATFHPYLQIRPATALDTGRCVGDSGICIVCLGGSTTAWTHSKDNRGWPERVEDRLRRRLGRTDIRVHNLGTPWYTSMHSLVNFAVTARPHRPDVVIVMHAINDLLQNADFSYFSTGALMPDYGHFNGPVSRLVAPVTFERMLLASLRASWYAPQREVIDTDSFPGLASFRRNLEAIDDLAQSGGVRLVLMTQPTLLKENLSPAESAALYMVNREAVGRDRRWSAATACRGMNAFNECTREVARRRGVCLIDLEPEIPKSLAFFSDDVHYRDTTFDLVADIVASRLASSGALDRPGKR